MNFYLNKFSRIFCLISIATALIIILPGCVSKDEPEKPAGARSGQQRSAGSQESGGEPAIEPDKVETGDIKPRPAFSDKPIADYQGRLLDTAYEIASGIPTDPHIKNRSRIQEHVFDTCLELDQPVRAVNFSDGIGNWRRGLCYAKAANYLVKEGYGYEDVKKGLDLAERIARMDHNRQWRNDAIKIEIASVYRHLDMTEKATVFEKELGSEEAGKAEQAKAKTMAKDSFDEMLVRLEALIGMGDFETTKNCLFAYARMFERFYETPERRELIEEKIKTAWETIPIFIRFDVIKDLIEHALDNNDNVNALRLTEEAQAFLDDNPWRAEDFVPRVAELSKLRFRAGDVEKAKAKLDDAWVSYESQAPDIRRDFVRAGMIIPLAEAYMAAGDKGYALDIYKRSIEEIDKNPNIRPRNEIVSFICCSMAVNEIEPDEDLWGRIQEFNKEPAQ